MKLEMAIAHVTEIWGKNEFIFGLSDRLKNSIATITAHSPKCFLHTFHPNA